MNKPRSLKQTISWFLIFAAAYVAAWLVMGLLFDTEGISSLAGPLIGIAIAGTIVVWWRHSGGRNH